MRRESAPSSLSGTRDFRARSSDEKGYSFLAAPCVLLPGSHFSRRSVMGSRHHKIRTSVVFAFVTSLALVLAIAAPPSGPRVLTSKAVYAGGESVRFSGYGFLPFENVGLQV